MPPEVPLSKDTAGTFRVHVSVRNANENRFPGPLNKYAVNS